MGAEAVQAIGARGASSASGLGSGLGGMLDIASGTWGALLDYGGMGLSYGLGQSASSRAHDRTKNLMTRGPTYKMIGLREAGLNPILAAGGALGVGGSGGGVSQAPVVASGGATPAVGSANVRNAIQNRLARAQTEQIIQQARKTGVDATLGELGIPEAMAKAEYLMTPEGIETVRRTLRTQSDPNDPLMLILKRMLGEFEDGTNAKDQPRDPYRLREPRPKDEPAVTPSVNNPKGRHRADPRYYLDNFEKKIWNPAKKFFGRFRRKNNAKEASK